MTWMSLACVSFSAWRRQKSAAKLLNFAALVYIYPDQMVPQAFFLSSSMRMRIASTAVWMDFSES